MQNYNHKFICLFLLFVFSFFYMSLAFAQEPVSDAVNFVGVENLPSNPNIIDIKCCPNPCPKSYLVEHLPTYKGSSINMVKLTQNSATICANNVFKVYFTTAFNSKNVCEDNRIVFTLPCGVKTVEGRVLLPKGTQVVGRVQCVKKPRWFNRNAKVYMMFNELVLPNCTVIPMCAKVYGRKESVLKKSSWAAVGKAAAWTVGLFGVGTGLGAAIGTAANASVGTGLGALVYGMPIGGGVGLIAGTVSPGLHYKAKCGKHIYIQLMQDLVLCYN